MKRIRPDLRANFGWERFQMQTCGREKLRQKNVGQENAPMRGLFRFPPSLKNCSARGDGNLLPAT